MLTDTALKNLRPKAKAYKSTDRDGMYVFVSTAGAISFRYDYRFNGRRETVTLGRYGRAGLTLAQARERLIEVKKAIADGVSPAVEKQRAKRRLSEARDFAQVAQGWMDRAPMADSTRDMRRAIFNRDILPKWKNRLLTEITPDDLRAHCKAIVDRGAPATAIHVRDIVKQIYGWAILHGEKIDNTADDVGPASIATFRPRDRSLSPAEIRIMLMLLGEVATLPTIRLGLKFILLSMVRKSELQDTTHRGVSRKRLGNSPRCSISQMVLSASGTIWRSSGLLIVRGNGEGVRPMAHLLVLDDSSRKDAGGKTRSPAVAVLRFQHRS